MPADGSTTSTITVTLTDAFGNPVAGKTVSLAQTGSSTISSASGPSSGAGVVTFTVTDTTAETVTYTATDTTDSVTLTQTPSVAFAIGSLDHIVITPSSATIAGRHEPELHRRGVRRVQQLARRRHRRDELRDHARRVVHAAPRAPRR